MTRLKHSPASRVHMELCEKPAKKAMKRAVKEGRLGEAAWEAFKMNACKRARFNLMVSY